LKDETRATPFLARLAQPLEAVGRFVGLEPQPVD
jgi:hypothetical protein